MSIWKQAGALKSDSGRFQRPQGRAFSIERALMFDNEIDWVTHLVCWLIRREAHEQRKISNVF
jgi:hypothetical protein